MAGPLDGLAAQGVGFSGAAFQFCLHGKGNFEGQGCDGVEQQLTDAAVDALAADAGTSRGPLLRCRCVGRRIRGSVLPAGSGI